jgi:hypothetical protein
MSNRLMATRVRLLDLYSAPEPAGAGPLVGETTEVSPVIPASPVSTASPVIPASPVSSGGPVTPPG